MSVVLPASGCEMIANVRREEISSEIEGMRAALSVSCRLGTKGAAGKVFDCGVCSVRLRFCASQLIVAASARRVDAHREEHVNPP